MDKRASTGRGYGYQMHAGFPHRLSRTYALHMETLDKHRGKGQQKGTVEHVNHGGRKGDRRTKRKPECVEAR